MGDSVGSRIGTHLLRPPASPLGLLLGHKWAIVMELSWPTRWGGTDEALTSELRTLGYSVSDGRQEVRPRPVRGRGGKEGVLGGPGVAQSLGAQLAVGLGCLLMPLTGPH